MLRQLNRIFVNRSFHNKLKSSKFERHIRMASSSVEGPMAASAIDFLQLVSKLKVRSINELCSMITLL